MDRPTRPRETPFEPETIEAAARAVAAALASHDRKLTLNDLLDCYDHFRGGSPTQSATLTEAIDAALESLTILSAAKRTEFSEKFDMAAISAAQRTLAAESKWRAEGRREWNNRLRRRTALRDLLEHGLPTAGRDGGWRERFAWVCQEAGLGGVSIARGEALAVVRRDGLLAEYPRAAPPIYFEDAEAATNRWKTYVTRFRADGSGGTRRR